jgi:hypothetical protein
MLWTKALEAMETAVEIVTRTLRGATQPPLQFALMVCATTLLYPRRSAQCDAKKNAVRPLVRHAMALIPSHPFVGSAGDRAADFHICSVALALLNTMCFKDGFAMTHASGQGLIVVAVALRHVAVFLAECDEAARRHGEDIAKHTDGILRSYQYHFARRASEDVDVHSLQDWTGVAIAELPSQHLTNDAAVKFVHDYCTQRKDDWTVLFPSAAVKCLHFALQQIGHASRHLPADELGNLVPRWIEVALTPAEPAELTPWQDRIRGLSSGRQFDAGGVRVLATCAAPSRDATVFLAAVGAENYYGDNLAAVEASAGSGSSAFRPVSDLNVAWALARARSARIGSHYAFAVLAYSGPPLTPLRAAVCEPGLSASDDGGGFGGAESPAAARCGAASAASAASASASPAARQHAFTPSSPCEQVRLVPADAKRGLVCLSFSATPITVASVPHACLLTVAKTVPHACLLFVCTRGCLGGDVICPAVPQLAHGGCGALLRVTR